MQDTSRITTAITNTLLELADRLELEGEVAIDLMEAGFEDHELIYILNTVENKIRALAK